MNGKDTNKKELQDFIENSKMAKINTVYTSKDIKTRFYWNDHENCGVNNLSIVDEINYLFTISINYGDHNFNEKNRVYRIGKIIKQYIPDPSTLTPKQIKNQLPEEYSFTSVQISQFKHKFMKKWQYDEWYWKMDAQEWYIT